MRTHEAQPSESARNFDHCEDEYCCRLECRLPIVVKKGFFFWRQRRYIFPWDVPSILAQTDPMMVVCVKCKILFPSSKLEWGCLFWLKVTILFQASQVLNAYKGFQCTCLQLPVSLKNKRSRQRKHWFQPNINSFRTKASTEHRAFARDSKGVTHDQIAQLYIRHLSTSQRVAVPSPPQGETDSRGESKATRWLPQNWWT